MIDYDVTKLPFISISREGVKMLKKLDEGTLYDVMQHVLDYVLTGEECDCQDTLSSVVCGMLIDTIDRTGKKAFYSIKILPPSPKKKTEVTVPASEKQPQPVQEPQPTPEPIQEPTRDDDWYFEDFLSDPAMDYSTLLGNLDYFKQRKARELNDLYKKLGRRYTGDQILLILQEKYASKLNNQDD